MKKTLFSVAVLLGLYSFAGAAYPPRRIDKQNVDTSIYTSSFTVNSAGTVFPAFEQNLSSGECRLLRVFVSSPGVNSSLKIYDNRLAGGTSNQVDDVPTGTRGEIPYNHDFDRGIVYTSTCTNCNDTIWARPNLRFDFYREK